MFVRLVAAAFVLLAVSLPVSAEPCTTVERFLAGVPDRASNRVLVDAEAQAWLAAYNMLPPATDIKADRLVFVDLKNGRIVLGLFEAGCGTKIGVVSARVLRQIDNLLETHFRLVSRS